MVAILTPHGIHKSRRFIIAALILQPENHRSQSVGCPKLDGRKSRFLFAYINVDDLRSGHALEICVDRNA